jgi:RNA polymerase sigma-70 factor (ECF subfamily)
MTKGHDSDEWLMGQVALGKRELLAPLVRRYSSPLLTFIDRMVGDRHRAEELFQEVFLAVWVKRKQYRFPRTFRSWLFAIAANRCRADYRRAKLPAAPLDETSHGAPVAAGKGPAETAVETETAVLVAAAVAQLPPQQRSVVVLRVWNGLSYAEIAASLGCAEGTVRAHMHHGLTGMRKFLEPRME